MKESTLWQHLKPGLSARGKFQKLSDRFTPGIPDVLGCAHMAYALELKQLKGIRVLKVKFRPGQLDWLQDWETSGGKSWIVSSMGQKVFVHRWDLGREIEQGMTEDHLRDLASLVFVKSRQTTWESFIEGLLGL